MKILNGFCNAARNAFGVFAFPVLSSGTAAATVLGAALPVASVDATAGAPIGEAVDGMPGDAPSLWATGPTGLPVAPSHGSIDPSVLFAIVDGAGMAAAEAGFTLGLGVGVGDPARPFEGLLGRLPVGFCETAFAAVAGSAVSGDW